MYMGDFKSTTKLTLKAFISNGLLPLLVLLFYFSLLRSEIANILNGRR